MNNIITEEIVRIVFPSNFNDGRYKRGCIGIHQSKDGWYINSVKHYVGKFINTINELDIFLKEEGIPFDFTSLNTLNYKELNGFLFNLVRYNFICHISNSELIGSILIMEKSGKAFARTYWFYDDISTIYFDWLSVDESERRNGIATELLNAHIELAKKFKVETMLWVKKDTWMHEWYKRKGYIDYKAYEKETNAIWMHMIP